jgi:hypothetical protein
MGAMGLLLEAKIFYEDQKEPREAFNRLRQMEEFYAHTRVFQDQGRLLYQKVSEEIDAHNRQFISYRFIDFLVGLFGRQDYSYVLAIVAIALLVRLILYPLTNKQLASMRKMVLVAPKLQELQQKYSGQELVQRQMALYKKYGVNPMAGCLYALLPIPFLIYMYNMFLLYQVQFQKGHFLWMNPDLGARFPGIVASHLGHQSVDHYRPLAGADAEDDGALHDTDAGGLLVAVPFPCRFHPLLDADQCVLHAPV